MPKEVKVCFTSWHFKTQQILLDSIIGMTPSRSGKWKNITAVTNPFEADYVVIFDGESKPYPKDRALFFGQHPKVERTDFNASTSFRTFDNHVCHKSFPLNKFWNPGEWWIDYDYDTLINLKPTNDRKDLCCIMTYQTHNPMYSERVKFMEKFSSCSVEYDLFGRPREKFENNSILSKHYKGCLGQNNPDGYLGQHTKGKNKVGEYRYSLEFDVGPTKNYISERFYDALLLWTMPIYFGSTNVSDILPNKSFVNIDIGPESTDHKKISGIVSSGYREDNIEEIAKTRELLLNEYQLWPAVHKAIFGEP